MKLIKIIEIFFVFSAGFAMSFIVIGSWFNFIPKSQRTKWWAIAFLVISFLYALTYAYFSWKSITKTDRWKNLTSQQENKDKDKKD